MSKKSDLKCDKSKKVKFKGEIKDYVYNMSVKEKKRSFLHKPNIDYS